MKNKENLHFCQWSNTRLYYHLINLSHPNYPPLLKEIANPPKKLYVVGNLELLQVPQIAIVGSRNPSLAGKQEAFDFAAILAKTGLTITSGLAVGIDTASHLGAIQNGGQSIAVLGNGLMSIYPKSNTSLAIDLIKQGGAIVSEFPPMSPPRAAHFPMRNRIISGLSLGTLVIEAALNSGSLITAKMAIQQNREVFAIPGGIYNPLKKGCHFLIQSGAKLVHSPEDILEELIIDNKDFTFKHNSTKREQEFHSDCHTIKKKENKTIQPVSKTSLDTNEQKLLNCIEDHPTSLPQLIRRSGYKPAVICQLLSRLELKGYINNGSLGFIRVKKK